VGGGEILETYLNSASKNTSETDIFPHGPKSLLTSAIGNISNKRYETREVYLSHLNCRHTYALTPSILLYLPEHVVVLT